MSHLDLSLVIPLFNEEESLAELHAWIDRVCTAQGLRYEVLFINDGSTDRTAELAEPRVVIVEFLEVAKAFCTDTRETGFVNAVLDHMARAARPEAF